jgi:hypothetical protein
VNWFSLSFRYCKTLDDLKTTRRHLRDVEHCNGVLYNENKRLESELAVLHAGNVELQRVVDRLCDERDRLLGAGVVAEAERIVRNEETK